MIILNKAKKKKPAGPAQPPKKTPPKKSKPKKR